MSNQEAVKFLSSLLGKNLRVQTDDSRMFIGQMKCTDKNQNIVLGNALEYRALTSESRGDFGGVTDVSNRFVGLIVIPGKSIRKIEIEKFDASKVL